MGIFIVIVLELCLATYAGITAVKMNSLERMFVSGFCAGLAFMLIGKACFGS